MKYTKLFLLSLVFIYTTNTYSEECNFFKGLSPYQKEVAYKAYNIGYPENLGYTMIAVAWKESKLGLYKVRYGKSENDRSFGVMHTVAKWKTKGMDSFNKGRWIQSMITEDSKSLQQGLDDLLYWKKRSKGNWSQMVGKYNGGNVANVRYAKEVSRIVNKIQSCNI